MPRTCACCGWRDSTRTIDWDGRAVAACDHCAGESAVGPTTTPMYQPGADMLKAVRRMLPRTGLDVTAREMCVALGLHVIANGTEYQRVYRALKQAKAEAVPR